MTTPTPAELADDRCTDCDDTGITKQTERRCACQIPDPPHRRTDMQVTDEYRRAAEGPMRGPFRVKCPYCGWLGRLEEHSPDCPRYPAAIRALATSEAPDTAPPAGR